MVDCPHHLDDPIDVEPTHVVKAGDILIRGTPVMVVDGEGDPTDCVFMASAEGGGGRPAPGASSLGQRHLTGFILGPCLTFQDSFWSVCLFVCVEDPIQLHADQQRSSARVEPQSPRWPQGLAAG